MQSISCDRCGIGKRTTKAKEQSCYRKDCDREHEASPYSLQYAKDFVFHSFSPFLCTGIYA